jgi:hypothetical protein
MMRFSVRVGLVLMAGLSTSSIAAAQVAVSGATKARDPLVSRAFNGITFGAGTPASGPVSRPPGEFDRLISPEGARLPDITAAPVPHGTTASCVMRVLPVDPRLNSSMPVVSVDKRADPKSVITIPTCQPRD